MNEQEIKTGGWIVNEGKQPVDDGVIVDVVLRQGTHHSGSSNHFDWMFMEDYYTVYDITHWRLHKEDSKSLEDAYDEPPSQLQQELTALLNASVNSDFKDKPESYYKAPETKASAKKLIYVYKKSAEQQVVDIFNQATGNSLTEKNLKDIIALLDLINKIGE